MTLSEKQWLFLLDKAKLIQEAERLGMRLTGGDLFRAQLLQQAYFYGLYFEDGKPKLSPKEIRTRTLSSMHGKRLAIDFNVFIKKEGKWVLTYKKEDIQPLGDYWEQLNPKNKWGGNWKKFLDTPHFQRNL